MANITPTRDDVQRQAENAVRQAGPWVEKAARAGYAAKGIVYIVIGFLALEAALSRGGQTTNSQGALTSIVQQPFGQFLLGLVGIGLAGYALWRFVEAGIDAEHKGSDAKGIATRVGYVLSGAAYTMLAFTAFQLLQGGAGDGNRNSGAQDWTARLMAAPFGQGLVGLIGLVVIGLGVAQIVKGYKADFGKELQLNKIAQAYHSWAVLSGRWGYIARGVVFAIIGGFFVEAAVHANPQQAKGLGSALDLLAQQSYGPWLLALVAAGLVSYGLFMLVEARYRRIAV